MLEIFLDIVLPVFLMAGSGAAVRAFRKISVEPISYVTLYIFSPCLAFHSLANTTLPREELIKIALFAVVLATSTYILSIIVARGMKLDRETKSAFLLTNLFMNSGNYGLPVAIFAFGQEGLDRALVFFVAQFALAGTLAVLSWHNSWSVIGAGLGSEVGLFSVRLDFQLEKGSNKSRHRPNLLIHQQNLHAVFFVVRRLSQLLWNEGCSSRSLRNNKWSR